MLQVLPAQRLLSETRPLDDAGTEPIQGIGPWADWTPTIKQAAALDSKADELFYGGAVGAGKTDFLLMDFRNFADRWGELARGAMFRRRYPDFREFHRRARPAFYGRANWKERDKTWYFENGATLMMGYLDTINDVSPYMGFEFTWQGFDELTDWPSIEAFDFMRSRLRHPNPDVPKRRRATGNPGRPGHQWVKDYFVTRVKPGEIYTDPLSNRTRQFIQAYLWDNPHLLQSQDYIDELMALNPVLRRAFLLGDWDMFLGQAFPHWRRERHVIRSQDIFLQAGWRMWACCDWNTNRPYAILYFVATPDGHIWAIRESYGQDPKSRKYNVGTNETAAAVARREWQRGRPSPACRIMLMDPSTDHNTGHDRTIAQEFRDAGWTVITANNDRVNGFNAVHDGLANLCEDGYPVLQFSDDCQHSIRTIPSLTLATKGKNAYQDVDTESEDHLYDVTRYTLVSSIAYSAVSAPSEDEIANRRARDMAANRWSANDPRWYNSGAQASQQQQQHNNIAETAAALQGYLR